MTSVFSERINDAPLAPEIRVRHGVTSHYAPLDLPIAGDVDQTVAELVLDTLPGVSNPDQFVLVIDDGFMIFPLTISGTDLRLVLGAQVLGDIVERLRRRAGSQTDRITTVSRPELGCEDLVIGYKILGRNKSGDKGRGPASSAPSTALPQAGTPFAGGKPGSPFASPFFSADTEISEMQERHGPGPWVEYLHGPLTFRCERADTPDVDPDALEPGDVDNRSPGQAPATSRPAGPFQTGRSQGGNGPFGPAFLEDGTSEDTAAEGEQA